MVDPTVYSTMVPANRLPDALTVSRLLAGVSVALTGVVAVVLLFPQPLADAFFAAWVLFAVILTVFGAIGAWTRRSALVWVAALLLSGLAIVGMWSIGGFIAPAALALLGAAVASHWTGPRPGAHETVIENPPSVLEAVVKTLAGTVLVLAGSALTYEGAVLRELFTRGCSSETLACALTVMNWDGVGLSLLGLAVLGSGGWLVWRQVVVGRVLASSHAG